MSDRRLAYSIAEAARIAGIGKSTFYADIANKHVPIRKVGRRSLVLHADLIAWLYALPSEEGMTVGQEMEGGDE